LKISESFLETTENYIITKYRKDGFLNTKVTIQTKKDTVGTNFEKLLIFIDRGERVKINSITFDGNDEFNDRKLRKKFKNTKTKFFGRFWK
jgi:outer membrane protein insertion porin family